MDVMNGFLFGLAAGPTEIYLRFFMLVTDAAG